MRQDGGQTGGAVLSMMSMDKKCTRPVRFAPPYWGAGCPRASGYSGKPLARNSVFPFGPGFALGHSGRSAPPREIFRVPLPLRRNADPGGGDPAPLPRPSPTGSPGRPPARIAQKREEAERAFHRVGITFAVYGEDSGTERLIPFDIVPRIIPARRMEGARSRAAQRVQRAQRVPARHLPRPGDPQGRRRSARARARQRAVPRARCRAWTCPAASTRTSPASTSSAPARASTTCSRTTCACPRACRTCSRTAR